MTKTNGEYGEFRGTTRQAILDIKEDIKGFDKRIENLEKRFLIMIILLVVAVIERLPNLISYVVQATR